MRISDWSSDVCSSDLVSRKKRRSTSARLSNDLRDRTSVTGTPRAEADEKNDRILIEDSSARSKASGGNTVTLSLLRARSRIVFAASLTAFASATARRSEEHTSELQSLMRISFAVFCLKKKHNNSSDSSNDNQLYTHIR